MKKIITLLILFNSFVFGYSSVEERLWDNGDTLLQFLQRNSIPIALYYNLDREDQELASEIASRTKYQILKTDTNLLSRLWIILKKREFYA